MTRAVVFLSGPIGVGKSTLGQALAAGLGWGFVEGDDHKRPNRPWYGSILTTSRGIVAAGVSALEQDGGVVIAYPLQCTTWIYHRRRFEAAGATMLVVTLRADLDAILAPARGRVFSGEERERIRAMIREGYGERPFSDAVLDTGRQPFEATLADLVRIVRETMALPPMHA